MQRKTQQIREGEPGRLWSGPRWTFPWLKKKLRALGAPQRPWLRKTGPGSSVTQKRTVGNVEHSLPDPGFLWDMLLYSLFGNRGFQLSNLFENSKSEFYLRIFLSKCSFNNQRAPGANMNISIKMNILQSNHKNSIKIFRFLWNSDDFRIQRLDFQ